VKLLQKIDEHLKKRGPLTIMDFVMEFDVYCSTLYNFRSRGFLISELIKSKKQNGTEYLLRGVNWSAVNAVNLPNKLHGRKEILDQIAIKTADNPMTLKELSRSVSTPVSTLRSWQYEGLLISEIVGYRTIIFGINRETYAENSLYPDTYNSTSSKNVQTVGL
jgi:hypothetical protein